MWILPSLIIVFAPLFADAELIRIEDLIADPAKFQGKEVKIRGYAAKLLTSDSPQLFLMNDVPGTVAHNIRCGIKMQSVVVEANESLADSLIGKKVEVSGLVEMDSIPLSDAEKKSRRREGLREFPAKVPFLKKAVVSPALSER